MTHAITHDTLSRLVSKSPKVRARAVGKKGGWGLRVMEGRTEHQLATARGDERLFRRFETLTVYLRDVGIAEFEVDARELDLGALPSEKAKKKSDSMRERMTQRHKDAAAYRADNALTRSAIREADDPATKWISHDDAMAELDAHLAALDKKKA